MTSLYEVQANMYDEPGAKAITGCLSSSSFVVSVSTLPRCLQDLVTLEFLPDGIASDKEMPLRRQKTFDQDLRLLFARICTFSHKLRLCRGGPRSHRSKTGG